jgi:hypothetical protein
MQPTQPKAQTRVPGKGAAADLFAKMTKHHEDQTDDQRIESIRTEPAAEDQYADDGPSEQTDNFFAGLMTSSKVTATLPTFAYQA